jgi:hypothetical protein
VGPAAAIPCAAAVLGADTVINPPITTARVPIPINFAACVVKCFSNPLSLNNWDHTVNTQEDSMHNAVI